MKEILLAIVFVCISILIDAQTVTTTYTYTWKYDTVYKGQTGQKDFSYSGSIQTFSATPGTYTLEVWGAQGGGQFAAQYWGIGGKGGYATGTLTINSTQTLYIVVGQQGFQSASSMAYNGGGYGNPSSSYGNGATGGGATHIATATGQLSSLISNQTSVKIVAGGGGGASGATSSSWPSYAYDGGAGGGLSGSAGYTTDYSYRPAGYGGTQNAGGSSPDSPSMASGFGRGACASSSSSDAIQGGGGGGGWYGGGAGGHAGGGGGGGSSYIGGVTSGYTTDGNSTFTAPGGGTETGHSGNGYARIIYNTKVIDHIDSTIMHVYVTTTITDAVCKNGVYNKYGFNVNGSDLSSGVHTYTNHFSFGNTDSTVILNITIRPDVTAYEEVEAPNSYTWPANGETYTESGIYSYEMVSQDGCDSTIFLALTIYDPTIGIAENYAASDIIVSPNPTNEYVKITNNSTYNVDMQLYNVYGQKIVECKLTDHVTKISLYDYPAGTYFLRFCDGRRVLGTKKLLKID